MDFSTEELDFFQHVFTSKSDTHKTFVNEHNLTVETSVPKNVADILGNAKLTLLAEISHYKLWFPLTITKNQENEFIPKLGIPEIMDMQGVDRSWRVSSPQNVSLHNKGTKQPVEILSLSSSGITMRAKCITSVNQLFEGKELEMHLPNQSQVKLALESVRTENNIIAGRFKNVAQGRDCLRKFLFNLHRDEYAELYEQIS